MRDVEPDLSSAARALAALVEAGRRRAAIQESIEPGASEPEPAPAEAVVPPAGLEPAEPGPAEPGPGLEPAEPGPAGPGPEPAEPEPGREDEPVFEPETAPEPALEPEILPPTPFPEVGHEAARITVGSEPPFLESGDVPAPEAEPESTFGGTPAARVALVTGAGRGVGRAIAVGLGRAGFSVALLGRSPDALEDVAAEVASYGVGASWAGADVREYVQVHNAVERLEAALGEIDLLVNNAGVIEPVEVPVWDAGPETWWHVVETDLRGPFHCVRAVVPGMVERGCGRVVNLSSGIGAGDRDIYSAYAAAKAGQFRITGSLHLAGFERGIRAFEISPGVVRTEMTSAMAIHAGRQDWTPVERVVEFVIAVAAGRLDAWSGGFLRADVDTLESLEAAELKVAGSGLPSIARRLGILPYGSDDPLTPLREGKVVGELPPRMNV